jgi:dolichol-phosphate mannosyltransferase
LTAAVSNVQIAGDAGVRAAGPRPNDGPILTMPAHITVASRSPVNAEFDMTASNTDALVDMDRPAPSATAIPQPAELSVVVPTFNERANIQLLLERLRAVLDGIAWEVIFVDDDSPDGTAEHIRSISRSDARVRCVQRIGRRGLSTACIEGILASSAPYVAVMDADLQHDDRLLPKMFDALRQDGCDVVVGSRYVAGGDVGNWDSKRVWISAFATWLSRVLCKVQIADPMSGFFMLRRPAFDAAVRQMSGQGFKILLDFLASSPKTLMVRELPYRFGERQFGESKLDTMVAWEFAMLIVDRLIGHVIPVRFVLFALIGGVGLFVHLAVLGSGLNLAGLSFDVSQTAAVIVAMTSNFFMNNLFTYRDRRLTGWRLMRGLMSFYGICALGAVANVGVASYLFNADQKWWLAGIVGAAVGAVWNYAVSSVVTWKR